ncbi:hypothetical protein DUI70_0470 [Streptomyces albus]|nr:hypothetical protein DUI70_0470 [Streptomyces albus]
MVAVCGNGGGGSSLGSNPEEARFVLFGQAAYEAFASARDDWAEG